MIAFDEREFMEWLSSHVEWSASEAQKMVHSGLPPHEYFIENLEPRVLLNKLAEYIMTKGEQL